MTYSHFLGATAAAFLLATGALAQSDTTTTEEDTTTAETEAPAFDDANADTVLATVDGTDITLGHVIALTSRLPDRFQSMPDGQLFNGVLEQLIQQASLASGMDRDSRQVQLAIENEVRALLATEKLTAIEEAATTDEAVEKAYEEQFLNTPATMEWKSQHILVETEEEANAIVEEVQGGADFGEVAKAKSTGPSGPNGGDLGWQPKGALVKPFEDAMVALEPGGISAPVQTQFGWHVIKLNEVREQPKPPLVNVRAQIIEGLKQQAVQTEMARAAEAAEVTRPEINVDPALIRNKDLLD